MSTSVSLCPVHFQSECRPDAYAGSCNDSLPRRLYESLAPLHKLQLSPSLTIPIGSSSSTHDNQSKLSRHSFNTAADRSNSQIHHGGHLLSIKWHHRNDLSTPRILPQPFTILQVSPNAMTSTAELPPPILVVEPLMPTGSASNWCGLAPPRP
jgi:hypothetical protein